MNFTEKEKDYLVHLLDKDIETILKDIEEKIQVGDPLSVLEMMAGLTMPVELRESIKAFTLPFVTGEPKPEKSKKEPKPKSEPKGKKESAPKVPAAKPDKPKRKYTKRVIAESKDRMNDENFQIWLKSKGYEVSFMSPESKLVEYEAWLALQNEGCRPHKATKEDSSYRTCAHCSFFKDGMCFDTRFEVEKNFTCELWEKRI